MRLIQKIVSFILVATLAAAASARAADNGQTHLLPNARGEAAASAARVSFRAILVVASDDGATDASLSAHEATLKRVLRFKSYRRGGGGETSVVDGGEATVAIGRGFDLDLWVTSVTEKEIVYGVRWFKGNLTLANTKFTQPRGSTTIIGGPAVEGGGGTYAVMLSAN